MKYEYKAIDDFIGTQQAFEKLNEAGKEGWKLISATISDIERNNFTFFLEREIQDEK